MSRHAARRALAIVAISPGVLGLPAHAAYRDDVGYTKLQADLGGAMPTGAGVIVSQVEGSVQVNGQDTWVPDPANGEFTGKTISQVYAAPAGLYSGHATAVGQQFYGTVSSSAPAITSIYAYLADRWVDVDFLWPSGAGTQRPLSSTSRVTNNSWIGSAGAGNGDVLRRLDYVIENDDMLQIVSHAAGGGSAGNPLLSSAFNVIAVGRSDDTVNTGSGAVDSVYTAGRARPDVVVPADSPSLATGRVSSLVALLVQTGHADSALSTDPAQKSYTNRAGLLIRNAERAEVIKAALMAGADRLTHNTSAGNLGLYRDTLANQTANGLDIRYGAGQANIRNSYWIIASGEQNSTEDGGPGSGSATRGFDYDPAFGAGTANTVANYLMPVAAYPQVLTAALVWHLDINGGTSQSNFNDTPTFRHLNLAVIDVTGSPVTVVTSQSMADNTQNASLVVPALRQYKLQVTRVADGYSAYDYGLAWQLLPDADGDGAPDGIDNCITAANGPVIADAGGNSQFDGDDDGYGNLCDGDFNQNLVTNAQDYVLLKLALGSSDPVIDLNGNGVVNAQDYVLFRALVGLPPGPSAIAP